MTNLENPKIKLNAARYFYKGISSLYKPGSETVVIPNKLYYICDALIWELYAAFDLILQDINKELGMGINEKEVKWNNSYKTKLKDLNDNLFLILSSQINQQWFKHLKEARNYISHHGQIFIAMEYDGPRIKVASLGVRTLLSGDGSIDLLDQTQRWIDSMSDLVERVGRSL